MADAKAKTINLLLYEGDLEGVISIEDSNWNSRELYPNYINEEYSMLYYSHGESG